MLRPRIEEFDVSFSVDGIDYAAHAWSDMSALQVVRDVAKHPGMRWRCESGLCGSCESLLDGELTRLCTTPARRLDTATIVSPTELRERAS
jgi:aerobic-type carbon monoxide dehydrogenase small subunit (CoxS/CutS family)